jgi:hypothetical protein
MGQGGPICVTLIATHMAGRALDHTKARLTMPKTITIDSAPVNRLLVLLNSNGEFEIHVEYEVMSAGNVIQAVHQNITDKLPSGRKTALTALFHLVAQDVSLAALT